MDPTEFEKTFGVKETPGATQPQQDNPQLDVGATQKLAQSLLGSIQAGADGAQTPTQQITETPQTSAAPITDTVANIVGGAFSAPGVSNAGDPTADAQLTPEQKARAGAMTGAAAGAGGLKSVFETKDFLFGDTPRDQQSNFRQGIEQADADMKAAAPIIGGLSSGIGQFTVAMMGLGKLGTLAKAVPVVGEALASGQAFAETYKYGKMGLEAGKAALAGAIAFDPHEARLSNLIQDTPLANSFNAWLAAKPGDSAASGRLKNAMESLGMDAAIIGTFTGGLKIWKYLKAGDTASASRAVSQLEAEQAAHIAEEQQQANVVVPPDAKTGLPAGGDSTAAPPVQAGQGPSDVPIGGRSVPEEVPQQPSQTPEAQPQAGPLEPQQASGEAAAQAQDIPVDVVANPTQAAEQAGVAKPKAFKPAVEFNPMDIAGSPTKPGLLDNLTHTLENAEKDWDSLSAHGDWEKSLDAGVRLSPDMGSFYDRFKTDSEVGQFIDLAVSHKADELGDQGFRVKLTDAKLQRQINAFASLSGVDPAGLAGILQQAGEASRTLTAKMVVVGSLAAKAFQDASLLAMRRKLGDYTEFGSLEGMEAEIAKRFSLATTFLKITDDIRSQGGRTVRANRGKPFDPALFEGLSKERFYDLLADARANPNKLKTLADPSLFRKIMDTVNYLRVSSLVSGPKTQLINIMTNGYMVGVRPLERILGSVPSAIGGNDASKALIKENLRQFTYMGSALYDGFGQAVKAFTRNDGVLKPHSSEAFGPSTTWQVPGTQAVGANYFKAWDSLPNVLYNAFSIPMTVAGVAPRALGSVDELVKQTVYRSKVAARAHMEGMEQAIGAGLGGKQANAFVKSYVGQRLENAFDAEGRGLDPEALREANIATFQQDLLPGTLGKNIQTLISNDKTQLTRLVLPFVKTPTNVIRYGWKMTPGLNMLQEEYRQMFSGKLGQEVKAQAVGQMTMGSLFMGAAAYIGSQGMVTGGGPSDPKLKAQLLATGWQPYSIVHQNEDGTKTYVPFNRYDPVALPFGIIADIQDAYHIMDKDAEGNPEIQNALGALTVSLAKQFTSRTYLLSLNQALDALSDPDRSGQRFAGGMSQSMVPFSGASRQLSTDPYLRDARTIADKMMQVIPGMSPNLPPKYNWLGQPVLNRQGLWSDDNGSLVDQETVRLGLEGGSLMGPPSPNMGNKVDLRNITTSRGENAYVVYQRLSGKPSPNAKSLRDSVADLMRSEAYKKAPDGDIATRGTKMWIIAGRVQKYREAAASRIRADKNVRDAMLAAQRKVIDHYQHLKQPVTSEQQGSLQGIIEGFGAGSK